MRRVLVVVALLASREAAAQKVVLSLRPHPGDTLHMRYDQRVETIATTERGRGDTSTTEVVSTLLVLSRTIIQSTDSTGSDVVAVTDSVAATSTGGRNPESAEAARHMLQGKQVHLRLLSDGAAVAEAGVNPDLRGFFAAMPAILPRDPTPVGKSWKRTVADPLGPGEGHGELKTTFRLDSLSPTGDTAFVSMRGTISQVSDGGGAKGESSGTVLGAVLLDLRRGWLTESRARIEITSRVRMRDAKMRMKMIVTQWLRAID
jgi:hypothetical protein